MSVEPSSPVSVPTCRRNGPVIFVGGGPIIGGKEIISLILARGLRQAGYRLAWFASSWQGEGVFISRLRQEKIDFYRLRLGFISISLSWKPIQWTLAQLFYWPVLIAGYLRCIKRIAPSIVIHNNWHHALLLAPVLDPSRDLYWSHEIVPNKWHYRRVFRAIARHVARVVCVSHACRRSLEALGVPPDRISVIHNGVDFDATVSPPGKSAVLRVGIVGQIGPWKGHDDLIAAIGQLHDRGASIILKIFGRGKADYVESLKASIRTLAIEGNIEWRGFVTDRARIFEEVDVCVMPTRSEEPFGLSALEASIYGRPVIATAVGGLPEIVEEGKTGFLVKPHAPDELAMAIEKFICQPELVVRMGEAARQRAESQFTAARFVHNFIEIIDEIIGPKTI